MAKTLSSIGSSECNRINAKVFFVMVKGLSGELSCMQTGQGAVGGAVLCADRSRGCQESCPVCRQVEGCQVSCPLCRQVKGLSGELSCV